MFFGRPRQQYPMDGPAMAPGAVPGPAPGVAPGPVPGAFPGPAIPPSGLLNMDIGPDPGLVNMDIGGPLGACEAGYEAAPLVHIVKCGDTVWKIAQEHNISMQTIIQANDLRYPDALYPGQRLVIPVAHY